MILYQKWCCNVKDEKMSTLQLLVISWLLGPSGEKTKQNTFKLSVQKWSDILCCIPADWTSNIILFLDTQLCWGTGLVLAAYKVKLSNISPCWQLFDLFDSLVVGVLSLWCFNKCWYRSEVLPRVTARRQVVHNWCCAASSFLTKTVPHSENLQY